MRLAVDGSNIRAGGGVQHLRELLAAADPRALGIDDVFVWSSARTLATLPERPWLHPIHDSALDGGLVRRTGWRYFTLKKRLRETQCDVLLVPGGIYTGNFRPLVAISQNVLPFQEGERQRYGWSPTRLRLELVRRAQLKTFAAASGVVFPTDVGRLMVEDLMDSTGRGFAAIPCGVNQSYSLAPRLQKPLSAYSMDQPFKWLYISPVDLYKHQWEVVAAVGSLRRLGVPIALDLVGRGNGEARKRLDAALAEWDPDGKFIREYGQIPDVMDSYRTADAVVFASSCETPSFVLLESMAVGVPIACSSRSGMPEVLRNGGEYFDPEDPNSIAGALKKMMDSTDLRRDLAERSHERSKLYTWEQCAADTLRIAANLAPQHRQQ